MTTQALATHPFHVQFEEPFSLQIDHSHILKRHHTLSYKDRAIKVSCVHAEHVKTKAEFTEIEYSWIRTINVVGSLYLHNCHRPIADCEVSEDLYLFDCPRLKHAHAQGDIYVYHHPDHPFNPSDYKDFSCEGQIYHAYLTKPQLSETVTIHNADAEGIFYARVGIQKVVITGDCHKLTHIKFGTDDLGEKEVVVARDGIFSGKVIGGTLKYEGEGQ